MNIFDLIHHLADTTGNRRFVVRLWRTAKYLPCVFGRGAQQRAHCSDLHDKLSLPCVLYDNAR
jgi:hypothetical protein